MEQPDRRLPVPALLTLILCGATAVLMLGALRGERAPDVSFTLLGEDPVAMSSLRGRPLLVNFWATTCSVCRREMPKLAELYRELHPVGLELIGVAMPYDPPNLVAEHAKRAPIPYPVSLDIDGAIVAAFGGVAVTPTTFLMSPEGVILARYEGVLDFVELRRRILMLLRPARPSGPVDPDGAPARLTVQVSTWEDH
ncbi:MAG TPA: TlpA disulfide reductase family protein [Gammaproteobacteria bacterium]